MAVARKNWVIGIALALATLAGCSKKITVVQYPTFWTDDLGVRSVAVYPFRSQSTQYPEAGDIVAEKLATSLQHNGTYQITNRGDLKDLLSERDLQLALTGDPSALASQGEKLTQVDAMLVGAVTTYQTSTERQTRTIQQSYLAGYNAKGRPIYGYRDVRVPFVINSATVECSVRLIRMKDQKVLHGANGSWQQRSEGQSPELDPGSCAAVACGEVAAQLVEQLAIVQKEIDVGRDALRTSGEFYDGEWRKQDKFSATESKMFVVVSLPPAADRNRFRVVIALKDGRAELAGRDIVWDRNAVTMSKGKPTVGLEFSPRGIAAAGGGKGKYTVKFYSGAEPVLTRDFRIE